MKALGFKPATVAGVIMGEAMAPSLIGAKLGMLLTPPLASTFHAATIAVFARFPVVSETFYLQALCAVVVGLAAGLVPSIRAIRMPIVEGLRRVA